MTVARVVIDVPARALTEPFDYAVAPDLADSIGVGMPVAVPLGPRRAVGYVVELPDTSEYEGALRPVDAILGTALFDEHALELARWIAHEYVAPLSEALRLFLPPGGAPRVVRGADGTWVYEGRQTAPVSTRIVTRIEDAAFTPRPNAVVQRAVLEALSEGPVTLPELAAEIAGAAAAVKALERAGAVQTTDARRYRRPDTGRASAPRHA
ncbi:MAG: primosomal protein N', partial [Coriobacteriia bacterium]|nr:primosomal protein N' [Coriobacteriia bacterium]